MSNKSWIDTIRPYELDDNTNIYDNEYLHKICLTEEYDSVTSDKLKTQLLPHQQRTVKAMLDIERKRFVDVDINDWSPKFIRPIVETSAAIISEKPGSGKTYEILALIAENIKLDNIAEITSLPLPHIINTTFHSHKHRDSFVNVGFNCEVRKMYRKIFRQTLIFVNKSVIDQWSQRIQRYTNLRLFIISDIYGLRIFYKMIFKNVNDLNKYDIILIKNGNIAGEFKVDELKGTSIENIKSKPILNIFGELFKCYCWNRIVLDDFDTLSIPMNATIIPSLFTWFISATKKATPNKRAVSPYYKTEDILRNYRPTYVNIWNNKELFAFFNIGCDNDFINNSTNASIIEYYVYKFVNHNDTFIGLIGDMGQDSILIAEMLNGDAIKTAAKEIGIKSNNVADIFEKILDKSWIIYKKSLEIDRYIPKVTSIIDDLPILTDIKNAVNHTALDNLIKNINNPGPISNINKLIKYKEPSVMEAIQNVDNINKREKENSGKAIQRVKNNLQQGDCPITFESLSTCKGIVVLKCCGLAISQEAAQMMFVNNINATCPNCRSKINSTKIILIDRNVDINKILNDDILENDNVEINTDALDKFNCIIKIIQGRDHELDNIRESRDDILIPNLLEGSNNYGNEQNNDKKIIIYTNYKETMTNLEKKLIDEKISYIKLYGTVEQITEISNRYWLSNDNPESINVLLISGHKYCAGLDLQNTTDLIFTHKIIDQNIETQIAGRAARYGRKKNLRIHYVLYENEYSYMFRNRKHK